MECEKKKTLECFGVSIRDRQILSTKLYLSIEKNRKPDRLSKFLLLFLLGYLLANERLLLDFFRSFIIDRLNYRIIMCIQLSTLAVGFHAVHLFRCLAVLGRTFFGV